MVNDDQTYVIGLDFGTLSVRAAVVRVSDGELVADAVSEYATPIMDRTLTAGDGRALPPEFALQVPGDYLVALARVVPEALKNAGIPADQVIGMGLDCTSASVVITDAQGSPMCENPKYVNEPQAYLKLWKHHGAQEQTDRIVALAKERAEKWLSRYGGILSSEMLMPKALELFQTAPELYTETAEILDIVDWLTWQLSGTLVYAAGDSGYKRMYQDGTYPSREYLRELAPGFENIFEEKMSHPIVPLGSKVGGLTKEWAEVFGLPEGIAIAAGNIDAHVQCVSVGAVKPGQLTGILGTSTCWILPSTTLEEVPGVFGVVDGGVCEGAWAYEAGQSAVGDSFAWFIDNCVPQEYFDEAKKQGVSIHRILGGLAEKQEVGEHGLVALDWWNGNRSTLVDSRLSGLIVGQTLTSRPEDQYRALLESTAFGARVIIENFEEHGVPVDEIFIAGGLIKDAFLMQIYADVTKRTLRIARTGQAGAHGSAIFAAVAAGEYADVPEAAQSMAGVSQTVYTPNAHASERYDRLYAQYKALYDLFGQGDMMHELRQLRTEGIESHR
ncbi:ribulokinase [Schaalia sp. ZJ405]|uniref:ribulokinase n=1 Tax=Schaalia sp. ZJ405 TaxID=2709403 RepID=UPI0013EE1EBD|nr:ribulokinase [Schaalia sp. ZJ405]QPK80890.1 ribulokinase [Schaalia sp. ZJ405]